MTSGGIFENLLFPKGGPNKVALAEKGAYSIMRISLGKGERVPPHAASHSAFFLVLRGKGIITSGDKEVELQENQYIAMEANQMRGIQALEDLVILAVKD
ncbi:MAG: cupin domain-containing protein [Candidatus Thorarchaeota archaeon]|jgi:quercetin dioxygenase-like cupin family protein